MTFLAHKEIGPSQDAFLSATGRALAICQHFEDCTRHVMVTWGVTDEIRAGIDDHEALKQVGRRLGKLGLGGGVRRLEQADDFHCDHAATLERGRVARNWFAHDCLTLIDSDWSKVRFIEQVVEFKEKLRELCEADALSSRASYEICEREPAPSEQRQGYAEALFRWAMDPIIRRIGLMANDD